MANRDLDLLLYERPIRATVGGWASHLDYDAETTIDGLTWLRVEGSFGRPDKRPGMAREDWVLVVPSLSISVNWYERVFGTPREKWPGLHWKGDGYHATRAEAMRSQHRAGLRLAQFDLVKVANRAKKAALTSQMLERGVRAA